MKRYREEAARGETARRQADGQSAHRLLRDEAKCAG